MRGLSPISHLYNITQPHSKLILLTTAAALSLSLYISATLIQRPTRSTVPSPTPSSPYTPSPPKTLPLSPQTQENDPYPSLNALPGARDVPTPYGSIRVYEWGPEDGERVLLVHGISTPVVALGDLGHELVARGYRVTMFDLFGRGYSDAPTDLLYDSRLYMTQILLALASSHHPWISDRGFHLIGYSLGGGLSVAFARYFPHLLRSLVLIAPCGLIRPHHVGWRSWPYHNSGLLPEFLVRYLVRRRIRPTTVAAAEKEEEIKPASTGGAETKEAKAGEVKAAGAADILTAEGEQQQQIVQGDGDTNGGAGFNSAPISKFRPHVTVSSVVAWQVDHHPGFIRAFLSTIRNAPIYAPQGDWKVLSKILEARRRRSTRKARITDAAAAFSSNNAAADGAESREAGLDGGKICLVLGKGDGVIVVDETIEDAKAVLGQDGVEFLTLEGGHELPITSSARVAESIEDFWKSI